MNACKRIAWSAIALVAMTSAVHGAESRIETRSLGDEAYELILHSGSVTDVGVGQEQLGPVAKGLCKEKEARFERYEFSLDEPVSGKGADEPVKFVLKQRVRCGGKAESETAFVSPSSVDWRPSVAEQATIERLTYQYFRSKDFGSFRDAYLMIRPGIFEWERWREVSADVNVKAGAVKSRRIKKITWYNNPPTGGPGVFAAVDFESEFDKLVFHCGYVAWRQQPNGSFLLVREEQNFIEKTLAAKMSPDELRSVRAKYRC